MDSVQHVVKLPSRVASDSATVDFPALGAPVRMMAIRADEGTSLTVYFGSIRGQARSGSTPA
jgi:S-adenosylmethionine synthetase